MKCVNVQEACFTREHNKQTTNQGEAGEHIRAFSRWRVRYFPEESEECLTYIHLVDGNRIHNVCVCVEDRSLICFFDKLCRVFSVRNCFMKLQIKPGCLWVACFFKMTKQTCSCCIVFYYIGTFLYIIHWFTHYLHYKIRIFWSNSHL